MSHESVYNVATILLLLAGIGLGVQTAGVSEGGDFGGTWGGICTAYRRCRPLGMVSLHSVAPSGGDAFER